MKGNNDKKNENNIVENNGTINENKEELNAKEKNEIKDFLYLNGNENKDLNLEENKANIINSFEDNMIKESNDKDKNENENKIFSNFNIIYVIF
jgi:hypothetical protein